MRGYVFGAWLVAGVGGTACGGGTPASVAAPIVDAGGAALLDAGTTPEAAAVADASDGSSGTLNLVPAEDSGTPGAQALANKVDILFSIDNSASMGDKQDYLRAAVPDLINQLINPSCVDAASGAVVGVSSSGQCAQGTLAFAPVHDMHIGIVSSSLGSRLGDACTPTAMALAPFNNLLAHNDDQAHLLNRTLTYAASGASATEGTVADAAPVPADQFLYWYPAPASSADAGPGTPLSNAAQLTNDFADLVGGAGVFGCGIESQLESWYRFLIQPDPYASLALDSNSRANWSGVDATILQQRHDFLRPDSLVAIVVLSDENDSEIDVRSLGQQGYLFMSTEFPPPRGTSACGVDGVGGNPADPNCISCAESGVAQPSDSNCMMGAYSTSMLNDWGYDLNLRHVHTKAKYGIDPQFPIQRYVNGLTSMTVPDRDGEYPGSSTGNITSPGYVGKNDCTNPLFAGALPTGSAKLNQEALCNLPPGSRTKNLVFYAHIGGVPSSLLHFTPGNAKASTLTDADWVKILGNNAIPPNYDYTGIDPHMVESFSPRSGVAGPASANDADPINGHDWVTNMGAAHVLQVDREYACTFPLADINGNTITRDCTQVKNQSFCDCPNTLNSVTADELPPICDQTTQSTQTGAKAYPTIRELELANLMGTQGIVSSICPIHVKDESDAGDDPLFGYRPAVAVIIDRLKNELTNQCLPEQLTVTDGVVPCLILVQLPTQANGGPGGTCMAPTCDPTQGLIGPGGSIAPGQTFDPAVLDAFCATQEAAYQQQVQAAGSSMGLQDPGLQPVCALAQLTPTANPTDFSSAGSCIGSHDAGWCYVTGAAAGQCAQSILFTEGQPPSGATVNLQCLEQSVGVLGAATSGTKASASGSEAGAEGD